ncbi:hypothetical protein FACS189487_08520 [Campylobacterota bacterium]|nr:hypothetical protein FACS189487_08520 [Campylobacterota bacterium]
MKKVFVSVAVAAALMGAAYAQDAAPCSQGDRGNQVNHGDRSGYYAADRGDHHGKGDKGDKGGFAGDRGDFRMFRSLDLTKEQKAQIDQIREKHRTAIDAAEFEPMAKSFNAEGFDRIAFANAQLTMAAAHINARADFFDEVFAVLTAEQKAAFAQKIAEKTKNRSKK